MSMIIQDDGPGSPEVTAKEATMSDRLPIIEHRCSDKECPNFGQRTSNSCGCHVSSEQMALQQRSALLAACRLLLSSAHDYQTGVAEAEAAIAEAGGDHE
jgi:hypothetical protein